MRSFPRMLRTGSGTRKVRLLDPSGFEHFGITVKDRGQLDECIALVIASGGALIDKGEHAPGIPYAYITHPDAYVIEI